MTEPLDGPVRPRRRATALAAAGLLGALASAAVAAPSQGAPLPAACAGVAAGASADIVTLRLLDLRPLGSPLPAVADLKIAATRAGISGATGRAAAQSEYVRGNLLGLPVVAGPLTAAARQQTPPASSQPDVVNPGRVDLGVARVGTGNLVASAAYRDPSRCTAAAGARSAASAALVGAEVLPGRGGALLHAPRNLATTTETGVIRRNGRTTATATASGGVADLTVFDSLSVHVVSRPTLKVTAAGRANRSTVEYTAPVLEVNLNDGRQMRLDGARGSVDVAVPPPSGGPAAEGLPVLPGDPIGGLLAALRPAAGLTGGGSAGSETAPAPGGLSGVPVLPGLLGGGLPGPVPQGTSQALVLRLSVGELTKEVNDAGVHARAVSLRLRLVLKRGDGAQTTLVDLCVGVLEVAAAMPEGVGTGTGGGGYGPPDDEEPTPYPTGSNNSTATATPTATAGGGPGENAPGNLPVTGMSLALLLTGGVGLLGAGRLLMVLARRRFEG